MEIRFRKANAANCLYVWCRLWSLSASLCSSLWAIDRRAYAIFHLINFHGTEWCKIFEEIEKLFDFSYRQPGDTTQHRRVCSYWIRPVCVCVRYLCRGRWRPPSYLVASMNTNASIHYKICGKTFFHLCTTSPFVHSWWILQTDGISNILDITKMLFNNIPIPK